MDKYTHENLVATLDGHDAKVYEDGVLVWEGNVPDSATAKDIMNMYLEQKKSPTGSNQQGKGKEV